MKRVKKVFRIYFVVVGILAHVFVLWMGLGWPVYFDRWLVVSQAPMRAEAIVCVSGGVTGNNLPIEVGMQRIYTAVQLYFDGCGRKVIFTGGGSNTVSEAEIYSEVAGWLGLPQEAVVIDPFSSRTADHPANILKIKEEGLDVKPQMPLNIVTSPIHSKRTALCFRKKGFSNFRMVTHYVTKNIEDPTIVRELKESEFKEYRPSGKKYDDFLFRLRGRTNHFLTAVRELVALGWYKVKRLI
jgi:uncharacterized SAM-binding protein YcdF (DUF218 family)